ncbi:hypothetical protein GGG87_01745 [Streptococcus sp. zg-86]|uniref:DUF2812 domain-containing protein n=1 Tax=Streptococcus zhangguiae TaxID=2664091 RepID=A0A6I4RNJ7_9STRE|nr:MULTISPECIES: hypothetical protein [unclassified Streptococcus]MTB63734.1 hypothetical protein [Streptococcus sp. zg-86]MTB90044.1 hypothetical protein [Streptococcus sp. zg-36]MWV55715.1 hypothetical protein [Streptococcus sp. zg-70]QTH47995.1 hypothetical protein J5M87_01255 [Streptococcus sp. zg-86]
MKQQRFKAFQPNQMEEYLKQMHQSGQALKEVFPWSGKMVFFPCKSEEMVCGVSPYVVWRKPVAAVGTPDEALLYNDRSSIYAYQKRIVTNRILSTAILPWISLANSSIWRIAEWKWQQFAWNGMMLLIWLSFVAYQLCTLYRLKKEL